MCKIYFLLLLSIVNMCQDAVSSSARRVRFDDTPPPEFPIWTVIPILNTLPPALQEQCREKIVPDSSIIKGMAPQSIHEHVITHPEEFSIISGRIFFKKKGNSEFNRTFLLMKEIRDKKTYYMLSPKVQSELNDPSLNCSDYAEVPNSVYDYISMRRNDFVVNSKGVIIPSHSYRYYKTFTASKTELSFLTIFCCDLLLNDFIRRTIHDFFDYGIEWIYQFTVKFAPLSLDNIDASERLTALKTFIHTQITQGLSDFRICGPNSMTNQIDIVTLDFSDLTIPVTTPEELGIPSNFHVIWTKPTEPDTQSSVTRTKSADSLTGL